MARVSVSSINKRARSLHQALGRPCSLAGSRHPRDQLTQEARITGRGDEGDSQFETTCAWRNTLTPPGPRFAKGDASLRRG